MLARVIITFRPSGVEVGQTMWNVVDVRGGQIARWAFFRSEEEALEAVGPRE